MSLATAETEITIRPLAAADVDAVVAIDAASEGHTRRDYLERRLAAARREPALHAQFAADDGQGLAGFILARVLVGEFGLSQPALRLEAVGVRGDRRSAGVGHRLLDALESWARRHGMVETRTAASWRDTAMLSWFDALSVSWALGLPRRPLSDADATRVRAPPCVSSVAPPTLDTVSDWLPWMVRLPPESGRLTLLATVTLSCPPSVSMVRLGFAAKLRISASSNGLPPSVPEIENTVPAVAPVGDKTNASSPLDALNENVPTFE